MNADERATKETIKRTKKNFIQSLLSISLPGKSIPHAINSKDKRRIPRVVFYLVPDILDVGINAPLVPLKFVSEGLLNKFFSCKDLLGKRCKCIEDLEFRGCTTHLILFSFH